MPGTWPKPLTRRQFLGGILALGAAAACTGRTAPQSEPKPAQSPRFGGTLKVANVGELPALDPGWTTATITEITMQHVFEPLFTNNGSFRPVPHLAERFEVSPDATRFVFYLRREVLFHNGREMTARDVVASLKRWGQVSSRGRTVFSRVDRLEETDRYTVTLTFKEPLGALPVYLAEVESMILPAEIAEAVGKEKLSPEQVIGTGPFRLAEYLVDRHLRLVRWEKYNPRPEPPDGLAGSRTAYVDELRFIPVPEDSVRADGVLTGEYHAADSLHPDLFDRLAASPGAQALVVKPYYFYAAHFNKKQGLFTDVRLRRAVLLSVDLEQVMTAGFGRKEFFRLGPEIAAPETPWYTDVGKEVYNRPDPEKARQLMREAGYSGQPIRWLTTKEYPYNYNMALSFKDQLEKVGFKVDLQVMDWATLVNRRSNPELYDVFITNHATFLNPVRQVYLDGTWPGWWVSERKDRVHRQLMAEFDLEKQRQLVVELQRIQWEELPNIKCGEAFGLIGLRREVRNFVNYPKWFFWNVWLA